jgi:arabinose-5-phosphate isomerase
VIDSKEILEVGKRVISIETTALNDLNSRLDNSFVEAVNLIYNSKGRVIVTGLGKSGAIARKISSTLTSTGTASYFLHASEGSHGDLGMVHRDDIVICISKSGETEEIFNLINVFKTLKVPIIALTGNLNSSLAKYSDVVLNVGVKEEACPHDLAPTSSTTATLAMGDALAIALLECRQFSKEDFALIHPGGSLGKKLLIKVNDLMETGEQLPFCTVNEDMKKVTMEMAHKRGICPIVDDNFRVIGVITTGDLNRLVERMENFFHVLAKDVMNPNPKTVETDTLATLAFQKMEKNGIIALPVVDKSGMLTGVIHLHDILKSGIVN